MNDKEKAFLDTNVVIYLYSEDMQDGQVIENRLTIKNIFNTSSAL